MPLGDDYDGSIVSLLEQLRLVADLDGVAIIDLSADAGATPVCYCLGEPGAGTLMRGQALLSMHPGRPSHMLADGERPLLACPWVLPPARPGGVLLWRGPGARPWLDGDLDLAAAVGMLLRGAIGDGLGQPAVDRLTGLPNRRWFLDEVDRHIDRLDRDGIVGTLMLVDVDDLRRVNQTLGRSKGDLLLVRMASELRGMVRPSDLVARVGPDELAIWHDGMDHLTAAERAEALLLRRPFADWGAEPPIAFSVGIASRRAGSTEDIRTLLRRAHVTAREVKTAGGGGWRVSHPVARAG